MTESRTDEALVRDALRGDADAFEGLVLRYQRVVFNAAWRLVGNTDDARDVCQNVFLKAYQGLGSFDFAHAFHSWLYRIALNEALNHNRMRRETGALDEVEPPSSDPAPDEGYARGELRTRLESVLAELSEDYRAVVVLKHIAGCSYEEIEAITGVPVKTVKSRLFTARQQLRKALVLKGVV